jgi:hypothetical protein
MSPTSHKIKQVRKLLELCWVFTTPGILDCWPDGKTGMGVAYIHGVVTCLLIHSSSMHSIPI